MNREDVAKLLLRLTLGGLMLLHGVSKIAHGLSGIAAQVTAHGLPSFVAYGVYVGEVLAPAAMILGVLTRAAGLVFATNMAVAVWLAHSETLLHLGKGGGYALELQLLYFIGGLTVALFGPGRYALRP
jgi:putative oxidoreductase